MHIHLCVVSAQLLANYIPIKMDKPNEVHLLSSIAMQKQGLTERFEKMLAQQGIPCVAHHNMPDSGMAEIQRYTGQLYKQLEQQYPDAQITVNITGGTKLMSIGLLDTFGSAKHRIIYTDTAKDVLESVVDCSIEPLSSVLSIAEYLAAYGIKVDEVLSADDEWKTRALQRRKATNVLSSTVKNPKVNKIITTLNAMALAALSLNGEELLNPQQSFKWRITDEAWLNVLTVLQQHNILELLPNKQDVIFYNSERTRFLCGHWLEEYAWLIIEDLALNEVGCSVQISRDNSTSINELDIIAIHNNRLLIIECKTINFKNNRGKENSEILYKIDSIGEELRGLYGQKILLSASEVDYATHERAKAQGIKILRPDELRQFVAQWAKLTN